MGVYRGCCYIIPKAIFYLLQGDHHIGQAYFFESIDLFDAR